MIRSSICVCVGTLAACGGGGGGDPDAGGGSACMEEGGAACFQLPTAPMSTAEGEATTIGCGPLVPTPSTQEVTFSGQVVFFGTGDPIEGADLAIYTTGAFDTPIATATSAADGSYSLVFPAATPDVLWASASASGALLNYRHAFRLDLTADNPDFDVAMFTPANIEGASVLVEEQWDPARAGIAAAILDCDRRAIMHAAVTVSSASGSREFVDGVAVFYGAPGAVPIVVPPADRGDTNDNGLAAVFRVPPGDSMVLQAWGFPDEAAMAEGEAGLVLVGETPIHADADAILQSWVWAE